MSAAKGLPKMSALEHELRAMERDNIDVAQASANVDKVTDEIIAHGRATLGADERRCPLCGAVEGTHYATCERSGFDVTPYEESREGRKDATIASLRSALAATVKDGHCPLCVYRGGHKPDCPIPALLGEPERLRECSVCGHVAHGLPCFEPKCDCDRSPANVGRGDAP